MERKHENSCISPGEDLKSKSEAILGDLEYDTCIYMYEQLSYAMSIKK